MKTLHKPIQAAVAASSFFDVKMTNCTVSGNSNITGAGGGLYFSSFLSTNSFIRNSIFWDNAAPNSPEIRVDTGTLTVSYSDVELTSGTYAGTGNINSNPQFISAAGGNYHLQCGSGLLRAGAACNQLCDSGLQSRHVR